MSYTPYYTQWKDWPDVSTPMTAAALNHIESGITSASQAGTALNLDTLLLSKNFSSATSFVTQGALTPGYVSGFYSEAYVKGSSRSGGPTDRFQGFEAQIKDDPSVVNKTVSNAVGASGKIRLTVTGHGFSTNDSIYVYNVTGTTEANGVWNITVIDSNTFDLQGSTFTNAYVSGGTATNRGSYIGFIAAVSPTQDRTTAGTDDVVGFAVFNSGTNKATDGLFLGRNNSIVGSEWATSITLAANSDIGIQMLGAYTSYGLDFTNGNQATYGLGAIRLPNNKGIYGRKADNSSDLSMIYLNTINEVQIGPVSMRISNPVTLQDGANLNLGSTTGVQIGTTASQKLGFYGTTPVVRPTGWAAWTGTLSRVTQVTTSATLVQVAETLGALINDLISEGLIGA